MQISLSLGKLTNACQTFGGGRIGMYKSGSFKFTFAINSNYPHDPPKVKCTQKVGLLPDFVVPSTADRVLTALLIAFTYLHRSITLTSTWMATCVSISFVRTGNLSLISTRSWLVCSTCSSSRMPMIHSTKVRESFCGGTELNRSDIILNI